MAFFSSGQRPECCGHQLDVIGNNIANSATYGFKSGSASFADMFAGSKVGLGREGGGYHPRTSPTGRPPTPVAVWTSPSARTVSSVWWMPTVPYSTAATASSSWMKTVTGEHAGASVNRLSGCRHATYGANRCESAGDLHPNDADGGEVHHHGLSADQPELHRYRTNRRLRPGQP